ncbi:Hypothetical protein PFR_JS2_260 [Propionibacterium freudenreichii]|nr:Hypothetical protein PFR_JS2_260 [Propionibacterium freudenreichii]SCQ45212.1 Hypothetical protein PFR_JS7-1_262 [Propionibacterium freudenreichii]SCQ49173.1 Hypothetical protein PFR_JS7-2_262 [Propionibacterium freudenreichii]
MPRVMLSTFLVDGPREGQPAEMWLHVFVVRIGLAMSTTPRLRITGLCLLACLLFSALLMLPLQARADPTPGQTWTDGACKKDAGITLVVDFNEKNKDHWPEGTQDGRITRCINPASAYKDAFNETKQQTTAILKAAGFANEAGQDGTITTLDSIGVTGDDKWVPSADNQEPTRAWKEEPKLDPNADNNGRFFGFAIGTDNKAFPGGDLKYADDPTSPTPAPDPGTDQGQGGGDAANTGNTNTGNTGGGGVVAGNSNNNSRGTSNFVPRTFPRSTGRVTTNPTARWGGAAAGSSSNPSASPSPSSSPSSSAVWGSDATPEAAAHNGNSPARLWLLGGIGALALGVIVWGSVMLYRMRDGGKGKGGAPARSADEPEAGGPGDGEASADAGTDGAGTDAGTADGATGDSAGSGQGTAGAEGGAGDESGPDNEVTRPNPVVRDAPASPRDIWRPPESPSRSWWSHVARCPYCAWLSVRS